MRHQEELICKELTEKMVQRGICQPFLRIKDQPHESQEKVNIPIDLGTIQTKLKSGSYAKAADWIEDVEQVWRNALTCCPEGGVLYLIALEMQEWFRRKIARAKWTVEDVVIADLRKTAANLHNILSQSPVFE